MFQWFAMKSFRHFLNMHQWKYEILEVLHKSKICYIVFLKLTRKIKTFQAKKLVKSIFGFSKNHNFQQEIYREIDSLHFTTFFARNFKLFCTQKFKFTIFISRKILQPEAKTYFVTLEIFTLVVLDAS